MYVCYCCREQAQASGELLSIAHRRLELQAGTGDSGTSIMSDVEMLQTLLSRELTVWHWHPQGLHAYVAQQPILSRVSGARVAKQFPRC